MNIPFLSCAGETLARWYVVRSKPRAESTARSQLARQGYRIYFPQILVPARGRGRQAPRIEPLFPRYLFLGLQVGRQSLVPVRSTVGVSDIVRFGSECATVRQEVVEALMRRADPQTGLHHLTEPVFRRGQHIRIAHGPFERLEGVFERYDGQERAFIFLDVLGRASRVTVPLEQLIPAPVG